MKLLTAAQTRGMDETAIREIGIPGVVLMENASRGLFDVIESEFAPVEGRNFLVVCGKGNNGGDGFAVARHILFAGGKPLLAVAANESEISGGAKITMDICRRLKIPMRKIAGAAALKSMLKNADVVIDALLGTGVKGEVRADFLKIINAINESGRPVVAVDVPSGVNVDDGRVFNGAVRARCTVTFGAPKIGLFVQPGASHSGTVYVADIGLPPRLLEDVKSFARLATAEFASSILAARAETANKGDCGKLLIVGGSRGMSGAVVIAGNAALRTGAGLVYVAAPESAAKTLGAKLVEGIYFPQEESGGKMSARAADEIIEKMSGVDAVVLGPGLGVSDATISIVEKILMAARVPVLVDADGLNCLSRNVGLLKKMKAPVVLTPHPGEMARLAGVGISDVQAARLETARSFAKKHGAVVVLKGPDTITAEPGGRVYVNSTGNPGMATAGSGDALSGVCGALLAEGAEPFEAAACAAFVHGLAGDIAAESVGERSVTAMEIAAKIPKAVKQIKKMDRI